MRFALLALPLGLSLLLAGPVLAAGGPGAAQHAKEVGFSFDGPFGTYDRGALQRGFQVYKEVCAACHGLTRVSFHALAADGGPGFSEAESKAIAASYQIVAGPNEKGETHDENGEPLKRPGITADKFPAPFANVKAAQAANNGSTPPDLSLITKARHGGPAYVYSLLIGYSEKPAPDFHVIEGKYYNPYFEGRNISMAPPLVENSVTYADGTKATVDQMAHDVTTFLTWAAEPKMEERKRMGLGVIAFLVAFSGLLFLSYRKVWADVH